MLLRSLPQFNDPDVAALAWAIGSAPLVKADCGQLPIIDEEWCDHQFKIHLDWLKNLDENPHLLKTFLAEDDATLLGKKFESLLAFWFQYSEHFELVERNIRFEKSGASGEADFLIREKIDGELIHLETACKYYIGKPHNGKRNSWIGPNGRDSLQLKIEKLRKQINVFRTTAGKTYLLDHQLETPGRAVFLKGYFFHPIQEIAMPIPPDDAHAHYSAGWYIHQDELELFEKDPSQWLILSKDRWMCPFHFSEKSVDVLNGKQMISVVRQTIRQYGKAILLIQVEKGDGMLHEISRGFVTNKR